MPTTGNTLSLGGSNITPAPVYSPALMKRSMGRVGNQHRLQGDVMHLMKEYDQPGISRSEGGYSLAAPQAAQIGQEGRNAQANVYLDDEVANQQQMLNASIARNREMMGLGQLALRFREMDQNQQLNRMGNNFGFLSQFLG